MSTELKKVGMGAFNTAKLSNEGVKMPIRLPDGTETNEFLVVLGADSKAFRGAKAKADRDKLEALKALNNKQPAKVATIQADITRELVASLVVGWSFDEPCDKANVNKFLSDSPQIQEQIDLFAGGRANFFAVPPQA